MFSNSDRLIWGTIPYWAAAVVFTCAASCVTVIGFVIQKKALLVTERIGQPWPRVGSIVLSPKWVFGFTIAIILPLPLTMLALALAPMSLLSPLGGFTILFNMMLAPWLLGEPRQHGPDLTAISLILVGATLSTTTGDHGENAVAVDIDRVSSLIEQPAFLGCIGGLAMILTTCLVIHFVFKSKMDQDAIDRPTNPPLHHVLIPAILYAGFGCWTNLGLKAVAEFLAAGVPVLLVMLAASTGVFPSAVLQLNFMTRGLHLYAQTVFLPISSALLIISNTFFGAVFYQEYDSLSRWKGAVFSLGVLLVVSGICAFSFRRPPPRPNLPRSTTERV